jgi:hypothetical protein
MRPNMRQTCFDLSYTSPVPLGDRVRTFLHELSLAQIEGDSELLIGVHFLCDVDEGDYPVSIASRLVPLQHFLGASRVRSRARLYFRGDYDEAAILRDADDDVMPLLEREGCPAWLRGGLEELSFATPQDICELAPRLKSDSFRLEICRRLRDALGERLPSSATQSAASVAPPLVSVLVAAHNEERYLSTCLDSCLGQTHSPVEVCVVDDGSADRTWSILQDRYGADHRVKTARFASNRGKVAAFNAAFAMARGAYIALLGADDVAYPDRVENSLRHLVRHGLDLVVGGVLYCDAEMRPLAKKPPFRRRTDLGLDTLLRYNATWGGTMFFNRRLGQLAFPIPGQLQFEDWWIGFTAALHGLGIDYLPVNLIYYRMHAANDCATVDPARTSAARIRDMRRHFSYYEAFREALAVAPGLAEADRARYLALVAEQVARRRTLIAEAEGVSPAS